MQNSLTATQKLRSANAMQGKYMEILFDKRNKIMGGRTTKYLLEKVRLPALLCLRPQF